jgi:hypothetical protein
MAQIARPVKGGGTRQYTTESQAGFKIARPEELDADLDLLVNTANALDAENFMPDSFITDTIAAGAVTFAKLATGVGIVASSSDTFARSNLAILPTETLFLEATWTSRGSPTLLFAVARLGYQSGIEVTITARLRLDGTAGAVNGIVARAPALTTTVPASNEMILPLIHLHAPAAGLRRAKVTLQTSVLTGILNHGLDLVIVEIA